MTHKRNKAPNAVANARFFSMITTIRSDLARKQIKPSNLKIKHYMGIFHIGRAPIDKISHLVFSKEQPSFKDCVKAFEQIKQDKRNSDAKRFTGGSSNEEPNLFNTPQITEEDAIAFLKDRGYTIIKQF